MHCRTTSVEVKPDPRWHKVHTLEIDTVHTQIVHIQGVLKKDTFKTSLNCLIMPLSCCLLQILIMKIRHISYHIITYHTQCTDTTIHIVAHHT